jgi:hypothetical protein
MLVGKDMDNEIETSFVVLLAKRRDPLHQGTCFEACGGCRYGSPLARGTLDLSLLIGW